MLNVVCCRKVLDFVFPMLWILINALAQRRKSVVFGGLPIAGTRYFLVNFAVQIALTRKLSFCCGLLFLTKFCM